MDVTESHHAYMVVDVSCNTADVEHGQRVRDALDELDGVNVRNVSDRTFLMHLGGKLEVVPKVALRNRDDLSRAYTPGVARVCKAIAENPADARNLTVKRNTIAVVTDGSAVLGLGNIGPAAALPVMEARPPCSSSSPTWTPGRSAWIRRTATRSSRSSRPWPRSTEV